MKRLIQSWVLLTLFLISSVCYANTQDAKWTDEILYYIFFDLFIFAIVLLLVKLLYFGVKLSKY